MTTAEFHLCPHELSKTCLRQAVYEMSDEALTDTERDIAEVWKDTTKKIAQKAGQSVYEMAAQRIAECVADGRTSIENLRDYVSRLPEAWEDRSEFVRCLQVHFPAEAFEPVVFKQQYDTAY